MTLPSTHATATPSTAWPAYFASLAAPKEATVAPRNAPQPPRATAEDLGMGALLRFRSMMVAEGQSVQLARMCFDRLYAYERIAAAHASASDPLRRLALELFQAYHRRDEARSLPT
jgi:hypothetical protein